MQPEGVHDLLLGAGLGLLVALQVGPMSLLLVRTTLRAGLTAGTGIGLGIALVDTAYAGVGTAGGAAVLQVPGVRLVAGLVGAVVLVVLGVRTLRAARHPDLRGGATTPQALLPALRLALLATAANPSTIASWAAVSATARTGAGAGGVLLVLGVGLGSLSWVVVLAAATAALRRGIRPSGVRAVDTVAGLGLLGSGLVLGLRTVL